MLVVGDGSRKAVVSDLLGEDATRAMLGEWHEQASIGLQTAGYVLIDDRRTSIITTKSALHSVADTTVRLKGAGAADLTLRTVLACGHSPTHFGALDARWQLWGPCVGLPMEQPLLRTGGLGLRFGERDPRVVLHDHLGRAYRRDWQTARDLRVCRLVERARRIEQRAVDIAELAAASTSTLECDEMPLSVL